MATAPTPAIEKAPMPTASTLTIGIAIATRDRWAELDNALTRIRNFPGLANCPLIVMDDASTQQCPAALAAKFPNVAFVRSDLARGYVVQRNQLARQLQTDLILSLDDDSYPIAGDIAEAAQFLAAHDDVICLAFNLVGVPDETPELPLEAAPFPVRMFIGCGHLMNRRKFLELEGYREELYLYNEEWELSARAAQRGWRVLCHPGFLVCHQRSAINRRSSNRTFYFARSKILFALWTLPLVTLPLALPRALIGTLQNFGARDWFAALRGCIRGWFDGLQLLRSLRRPFTMATFRQWRALPWPPSR